MRMFFKLLLVSTILAAAGLAQMSTNADPDAVKFVTSDIDLFWKAYDKATAENAEKIYQDEYLAPGTDGLQLFLKYRIGSAKSLAAQIAGARKYYEDLREPSRRVASFEPKMRASFRKLKELYPDAIFPNVYFVIGRMNSAGTLAPGGLLIGVDMFGANGNMDTEGLTAWHRSVLGPIEKVPFVVAHESIHYQQKYSLGKDATLLQHSIKEGSADLIAELISGGHVNLHLKEFGDRNEEMLWTEFKREMNGKDLTNWLYQGDQAKDRPADLGYYMGYKITESYYRNAADKRAAIKEILEIKDFEEFLKTSRYEEKFGRKAQGS
jgi:hypothetical protein